MNPAIRCAFVSLLLSSLAAPAPAQEAQASGLVPSVGSLPLTFVENRGQWPEAARFRMRRGPATAWFVEGGWVLTLERTSLAAPLMASEVGFGRGAEPVRAGTVVSMRFVGAEPVSPTVVDPVATRFRYGSTETRGGQGLHYRELYRGIDVAVGERQGLLAYDLHLAAGADLGAVVVQCEGLRGLSVRADGALVFETELGPVVQTAPVAWTVAADTTRERVAASFRRMGDDRFGFAVPEWRGDRPLVVDPGLDWSTFLGGSAAEQAYAMALADGDRVAIVGITDSPNFPLAGVYRGGRRDAFAALLDPSLQGAAQLVWATYLGGSDDDIGFDVAFAPGSRRLTVVGMTRSTDFGGITPGAMQTVHGGDWDGFVVQLDANGRPVYGSYFGGAGHDRIGAVASDAQGALITMSGFTSSVGLPVHAGAYQPALSGGFDAFVLRMTPAGNGASDRSALTYLGGSSNEGLYVGSEVLNWDLIDLGVGASGHVTVASRTASWDFPVTANAYQPANAGGFADIFLSRLDATLSQLIYSTYLGGSGDDAVVGLDETATGEIYLAGLTWGTNFPVSPGAFDPTANGFNDGILVVLDPARSGAAQLRYSTHVGGAGYDVLTSIVVEDSGIATVSGMSGPVGPSATNGTFRTTFSNSAGVALRLDPRGGGVTDLHYLSFLGAGSLGTGDWFEIATATALRPDGRALFAGFTDNPGFNTNRSRQAYGGGTADATLQMLDLLPDRTVPYGTSTPTCLPPIYTQVNSNPWRGNAAFELHCNHAPAFAPGAFLLGSAFPLGAPVLGATLYVDPTQPMLVLPVGSNAVGFARLGLAVPASLVTPAGLGVQWIWVNPSGCNGGQIAASNALEIR